MMRKWLLIGGILIGTLCGFVLMVSVGVWLVNPPHPPTPSPTRGEGEQIAVAATDTAMPTDAVVATNAPSATDTAVLTNTVEPMEVDMLTDVQRAMDAIPLLDITSVVVNDDTRIFTGDLKGIVQVAYRTPTNRLDIIKLAFQDILCAYQQLGYTGYRLRLHAENSADMGLVSASIEPDVLAIIDCDNVLNVINWENATSEWSVASGVQR